MLEAEIGGGQGDFLRQVGHDCFLHGGDGVESGFFRALTLDPLLYLVHRHCWRDDATR